jgi:hypothetical protein
VADKTPAADRRALTAPSLMRMSAGKRMAMGAALCAAIWAIVLWALQ